MKPVQPGQTYVYDFTVHDQDIGTYWYHSHYDDMEQVAGGFYGAFIVDPRPGTPQARQAINADVEYKVTCSNAPSPRLHRVLTAGLTTVSISLFPEAVGGILELGARSQCDRHRRRRSRR